MSSIAERTVDHGAKVQALLGALIDGAGDEARELSAHLMTCRDRIASRRDIRVDRFE